MFITLRLLQLPASPGYLRLCLIRHLSTSTVSLGALTEKEAYYGCFALAPTLVIAIAIAGILFGEDAAQGRLAATLEDALGSAVAQAFAEVLTYVHVTHSGWTATVIGFGLVLFASTGLFTQLQLALNAIWGVQPKPGRGFWNVLRGRFFAFILVLGTGALLVLSLIANTALLALNSLLQPMNWSGEHYIWEGIDWFLTLVLQTLLFASFPRRSTKSANWPTSAARQKNPMMLCWR